MKLEAVMDMDCPVNINKLVDIEGKITISPDVEVGDITSCCVGAPNIERICDPSDDCAYMVSQLVCVRFPIKISATAAAEPTGVRCDPKKKEGIPPARRAPCRKNPRSFFGLILTGLFWPMLLWR